MLKFTFEQPIRQLEPKRGAYYYLRIGADSVNQFKKRGAPPDSNCVLEHSLTYSCGLNHIGDGDYLIIVAKALPEKLDKRRGDEVNLRSLLTQIHGR